MPRPARGPDGLLRAQPPGGRRPRRRRRPAAAHEIEHAEFGHTTNVEMADATVDDAIVAYEDEGEPIENIHGGPVRIVIPHLWNRAARRFAGATV
ncbi:MAG: molybdopterin-dependent oxidoreductase [Ilumatobacteraceae bacterium]